MSTASTESFAPRFSNAPESAASEANKKRRYDMASMVPWVLTHLAAFGLIWSGVTWWAVGLGLVTFWVRMFAVTGVYHRYFSHRTYSTSRVFQFVLAFLAQTSTQRGVLWWAAHHRAHHLYSDTERDLHSVKQDGFMHAHFGWIFEDEGVTDWKRIQDFSKYPELVWLDRFWLLPPVALALTCLAVAGWPGLFLGFFLSQVLVWHSTYCINSLAHVWGSRRFETKDSSRNNVWLALLTLGEGWHNNHHHHMRSCRQGFYWWEIDVTYYVIRALGAVGLVWDIKEPPARVLEDGRRRDAAAKARAAAA